MSRIVQISKSISIEDLVEKYPFASHYLAVKGIRCVACGETVWLTLEEAAKERGFDDDAIDEVVNELKMMALNEINIQNGFKAQVDGCPNPTDHSNDK